MADLNLCFTDPVSGDIIEQFSISSSFMTSPEKIHRMISIIRDDIRQEFDVGAFVPKEIKGEAGAGFGDVVHELKEMNRCLFEIQNYLGGGGLG